MEIVCELCKKTCNGFMSTKIKDGCLCFDCSTKLDSLLGKHDSLLYTAEEYRDMLMHPASTLKIKKSSNPNELACCVCGETNLLFGKEILDNQSLCEECATNCITVSEEYTTDPNTFFKSHNAEYFQNELEECYNPRHNIVFNYKTKKIYLKDTLSKKNYKLVNFEDVVCYRCNAGECKTLDADIRYNGSTIRYHIDDSTDKHCEFDKVVDCFSRIPHLGQSNNNSLGNGYSAISCPVCGGGNCTPIVETSSSGKDFSAGKGCCGLALLGPIGLLCGACGEGKQTTSTTYWVCTNCGNKFQR